jgi:hypothetical protein
MQPNRLHFRPGDGYPEYIGQPGERNQAMGNVVVYHFEVRSSASAQRTLSKRPATRETIEALGFEPLMETAQVVERSMLDAAGYLPGEVRSGG